MDFELTEEQKILRDTVRDFADREIWPHANEWDNNHIFPHHIFKQLGEMGYMGITTPAEYGGMGLGTLEEAIAEEEVGRGCPSIALTFGGHMGLGQMPFILFGNEEQKQKYLPKLASGEWLGAYGLTEPNAGSDAYGCEATAVQAGDYWILNGNKVFISNPGVSYGVVSMFVTGIRKDGRKELSTFVIDNGTPGYTVGKEYDKMAWMSGDTHEISFQDCRIPKGNMIGERGAGLRQMLTILDVARIGFASGCVGLAQRAYELALDYAKQRVQFGHPISSYQLTQNKIAQMVVDIEMSRLLTHKSAWLCDAGKEFAPYAAMAKYYASETAFNCANMGLEIFGGYGFMRDFDINRLYRFAKVMQIGEGTNDITKVLIIARSVGCV